MSDPHVITALERKRAELAGDLKKLDKQRASIKARIAHVDATLKLFGYEHNPAEIAPVVRHARLFRRSELKRLVREFLRENDSTVPNKAIATYVCQRKGWNAADDELVGRITQSVKVTRRAVERE